MKKVTAHLICHTHWDREWYLTREVFRTKLVRLIDKLLNIVETVPGYVSFMLDGQTIILEDYLEIRPENTDRLKAALKKGKILCGPWYILPDEVLISGESHIRNYLMGLKVSSRYGGHMNAAYLPDSFGHPEQMPQIIEGLGMEAMLFWRGTSSKMNNIEIYWQSPYNKSRILCIHLPAGYGNSASLLPEGRSIIRLENMIKTLHERSSTDVVLLMNGSDHITAQEDIVDIVNEFNQSTDKNYCIKLSTLPDYLSEVKKQLTDPETFTGEIRYGDRSMLLGGTISTRMPLKQRNHTVQKKMERYLEPLQCLQQMLAISAGFSGYNDYIWRGILENHPHDSICGCSIDEVHREMLTRFDCVEQLQDELMNYSIIQMEHKGAVKEDSSIAAQLMLFEPVQDRLPDYVELDVDVDPVLVQEVDYDNSIIVDYEDQIRHPDMPEGLFFRDESGREIRHVILSSQKTYYSHLQDETAPEIYKVNRFRVGLMLPAFDYGKHIINVYKNEAAEADKEHPVMQPEAQAKQAAGTPVKDIENEFYRISYNDETGALDVLNKKTGRLHTRVHRIVDKGDAGDEYTYSWPHNDKVFSLTAGQASVLLENKGELCSEMVIQGCLQLPVQLSEDRKSRSGDLVSCELEIRVRLYKGIDRIDFLTRFDNQAKDHRLQVEFPTGVLVKKSSASGPFGISQRDIDLKIPEHWLEYPQSTHPNHGFVHAGNDEYGLTVAAPGLTEYEAENVEDQTFIRLTLLRCVGWLSRSDLLTRKANGGWTIETPEAQCVGRHEFEYSIIYNQGNWRENNAYGLCDRKMHSVFIRQLRSLQGSAVNRENPLSFLSQLHPLIRISAIKPAENGEGIIMRLFSIADEPVSLELTLPEQIGRVYETNLKEERIRRVEADKGLLTLYVEPGQIITFELLLKG